MKYCIKCGHPNVDDAKFCQNCGDLLTVQNVEKTIQDVSYPEPIATTTDETAKNINSETVKIQEPQIAVPVNKPVTGSTKKPIIGMILGIVSCALLVIALEITAIIEVLFVNSSNMTIFISSIIEIVFFSVMIATGTVGLVKSVKTNNLIGKILNPIGFSLGYILLTSSIITLIELFVNIN